MTFHAADRIRRNRLGRSRALPVIVAAVLCSTPGEAPAACLPDATHACLSGGRFRAEVLWSEPTFAPGGASGQVFPLTDGAAAFWFFQPGNLELVFKVLDGRAINGRQWLFAASLTTVAFDLRVTDAVTGFRKSWFHPASPASSVADVGAFSDDPLPGAVMFAGAHPDDETMAAPVLGRLCVEMRRTCSFLVATRGESGICRLAGGCHPDLASLRSREMEAAASLYGAALTQWDLPDVTGPDAEAVRAAWAERSGGDEALVTRIAAAISAAAPEVVVTFDPRHGSTCHPAHRALGALVLDAVARLGAGAPSVHLLETRIDRPAGSESIRFAPVVPEDLRAISFDATAPRNLAAGGTAWDYLLEDARAHPSQFDGPLLAAFSAVPDADRLIRLLPGTPEGEDPRYSSACPGPASGAADFAFPAAAGTATADPARRRFE